MPRNVHVGTSLAGLIALTACMAQGKPEASSAPSGAPRTAAEAVSASPATAAPAAVVERARDALRAAGLPADSKLLTSEQTQWNDSSLGCPQPGAMYTQVITSGYLLRFAGQDSTHEVHVAADAAILCSPQVGTGVPNRSTAAYRAGDLDAIVETARADLAAKLNLQIEEVSLRSFEPTTWPDSRLGCGEALADAAPGPVRGFKLKLALLTAGTSYFLVTALIARVQAIPRSAYDHARVLGYNDWQVFTTVVVRGTLHDALEIIGQNSAIGWGMIIFIEVLNKSEGGIGAMIQVFFSTFNLAKSYGCLFIIGLVFGAIALCGLIFEYYRGEHAH